MRSTADRWRRRGRLPGPAPADGRRDGAGGNAKPEGTPAAFALVDLVYALGGRISSIYLADAVVELVLLAGLFAGWWAWGGTPDERR